MPPEYHSKEDVNNAAIPEWSEYANGLVMVRLADVEPKPITWLWPGRIARGKFSIIAGDPGLGKSLVTLDMTARVSRGRAWPDGSECPVGNVILLSAEDDAGDTIRPRLDALGVDPNRVQLLEAAQEVDKTTGKLISRSFSLRRDIDRLSNQLAKSPGCVLVIIDPISAYLDGTESHNNADVRSLLAPLCKMAGAHNIAIVGVNHLNKGGHAKAIYRIMGSLAFGAAARAAWGVAEDPEDKTRRLFLPIKTNLSANKGGLAFWVRPSLADPDVPIIEWAPDPVEMTAQEAFMPMEDDSGTAEDEAIDWLRDVLSDRDMDGKELKRLAKEASIAKRTLYRAAKRIGVQTESGGFGKSRRWSMCAKDPHVCQSPDIGTDGTDGTHGEVAPEPEHLRPCLACDGTTFWRPEANGGAWRCCSCTPTDTRLGRLEFAEVQQ